MPLTSLEPMARTQTVFLQPSPSSTLYSRPSAQAFGDARWPDLVDNYQHQVGKEVARRGGRVVNTAGDGVFATFDGQARAQQVCPRGQGRS